MFHIFKHSRFLCLYNLVVYHAKNTSIGVTRKRVHWGQTPFRVNDYLEIRQLDTEYDPELGKFDY